MNRKEQHPQQQTTLPLSGEVHWGQLRPKVRQQCRTLIVELLTRLAQRSITGGGDDER